MSIEERLQQAAQNILENSSLSDDLMDTEAQLLLDWGLNLAERFTRSTTAMDDSQAAPFIDEALTALRRTMRRVGRLIGNLQFLEDDKAESRLTKILDAAGEVPGVAVQHPNDIQSELEVLRGLPPGKALEHVLAWIRLGGEEADDEA